MAQDSLTDDSPLYSGNSWLPDRPPTSIIAYPYSGDYRIDGLLESLYERWNYGSPVGTNVAVTYSFAETPPVYAEPIDIAGFQPFTTEQRLVTRSILNMISQQVGIDFVEVEDTPGSYGKIRFSNNNQAGSSGYTFLPNTEGQNSGDVYINRSTSTNVTPGSYNYATLVHEIGHALGLKHPGNYNAGEATYSTAVGNFLGVNDDKTILTVMSYWESDQGLQYVWYAPYDILALRYLYGARAYNDTDTVYTFTDEYGQFLNNIVDDGGYDTIDLSALTLGANLNINQGAISSLGKTETGEAARENLSISIGATIENVIGTPYGDRLTLSEINNRVEPGGGNDTVVDDGGIDTAVYHGNWELYTIAPLNTGLSFSVSGVNDGFDNLTGIERLAFSDGNFALDLNGNAGNVARVIGIVFGSEAVRDPHLAGIGLNLIDNGTSYQDLMSLALNAQLGTGFSDADEINLLYQNLTGSRPDPASLDYWAGTIASGQFDQVSLGVFAADSDINAHNIDLVGLTIHGLAFV